MNDEELNRMLHTWKAEADLPSSFQRDVWRRIESVESARPAPAGWLELLLNWVARPIPATALCALALGVGITAGGMIGDAPREPDAEAYANSINPFAKASLP